ncbi:MAG: hypothetical protein ABIA37_02405 [Candidatus Woesearchaeota archaeon]
MVTKYTKVKDYQHFLEEVIGQINPGSAYQVDVDFVLGNKNVIGEIEDCKRISRFYQNGKLKLTLEIGGIRYDCIQEVEEDREKNIDSLIENINKGVKKIFPNGIVILSEGEFKLNPQLF